MGKLRSLFVYFRYFQTQILQKNLRLQQHSTRIVGVEREHADHLTTTTAQPDFFKKMGQSRPLFLFIFVFSTCHNLNSSFKLIKA